MAFCRPSVICLAPPYPPTSPALLVVTVHRLAAGVRGRGLQEHARALGRASRPQSPGATRDPTGLPARGGASTLPAVPVTAALRCTRGRRGLDRGALTLGVGRSPGANVTGVTRPPGRRAGCTCPAILASERGLSCPVHRTPRRRVPPRLRRLRRHKQPPRRGGRSRQTRPTARPKCFQGPPGGPALTPTVPNRRPKPVQPGARRQPPRRRQPPATLVAFALHS